MAAARRRVHPPALSRHVLPGAAAAHQGRRPAWLADALAKCSLLPARLLQDRVPALARKGRLQPGADADLVVFDPATVTDQATYTDSTRPSTGIRHVLVNGSLVVRDGQLDPAVLPGRPVRA